MQRPLLFDGQLVDADLLTEVEDTAIAAIKQRTLDLTSQRGIISGLVVSCPSAWTLRITAGYAYDGNGERIEVTAQTDVAFPNSPGYYVLLSYTYTDGTPVTHPLTGVATNTRRVSGWTVSFSPTESSTAVTISQITSITGGGIATLNSSARRYWKAAVRPGSITDDRIASSDNITTHVAARGTGAVSDVNPHGMTAADVGVTTDVAPIRHQQRDHVSGFEPPAKAASLTTSDLNESATITYTAVKAGLDGNEISVLHTATGLNSDLAVVVTNLQIEVQLATDELGLPTSSATEVAAACEASLDVSRLVTALPNGDGSGIVQTLTEEYLTGGDDLIETTDYGKVFVISGSPDTLEIGEPAVGDSVLIDGQRLTTAFSPATLTFASGHDHSAVYEVWARSDGTIGMESRAIWLHTQVVTGVQIAEIDDKHPNGKFGLVFSGAVEPSLSWAGGPSVVLDLPTASGSFSGDAEYRLRSGLPGMPGIVVQVTWAQLPTTNSEVDLVEIHTTRRRKVNLPLAQVWWSGRETGKLGVGAYGASGVARDLRSFGNLSTEQLHPEVAKRLAQIQDETRSNGVYQGGQVSRVSNLEAVVGAAIVWINGNRLKIGQTRLALSANATTTVLVDQNGTVRITTSDPSASMRSARYVRLATITTDATAITRIADERVILGDVDEVRMLGREQIYSEAAQQVPRICVPTGNNGMVLDSTSALTLVMESDGPPGLYSTRWYVLQYALSENPNGAGFLIAVNARWVPAGQGKTRVWAADSSRYNSVLYQFYTGGFSVFHKRRTDRDEDFPMWAENDWDNLALNASARNRTIYMGTQAITKDDGYLAGRENPDPHVAVQNKLLPKGMCKAWGIIRISNGVGTCLAGYGVNNLLLYGGTYLRMDILSANKFREVFVHKRPLDGSAGDFVDGAVIAQDSMRHQVQASLVTVGGTQYIRMMFDAVITNAGYNNEIYFAVWGAQ